MTAAGKQFDDALLREAAHWFVRVHGEEATTEEFASWQQWLAQDGAHRAAFKQVENFWQEAGLAANAPWPSIRELSGDSYQPTVPVAQWLGEGPAPVRNRFAGFRSSWTARTAIAASLVISTMVVGWLAIQRHSGPQAIADSAVIVTSRAEDRRVALSDGSRLTVGAESRIDVDLSDRSRSIVIDSGEAFFDVARERRPFIVRAGGGTVTAIGTAFNVRSIEGRVVVTVTEGRVKVTSSAGHSGHVTGTLLEAGEQMAYGQVPTPVRVVDADIATAWRRGQLKYLNEPLKFVVRDVSRYARQQITVEDPAVGEMLYTGTVLPDEIDDWLESIHDAFPVEIARASNDRLLLRERRASRSE